MAGLQTGSFDAPDEPGRRTTPRGRGGQAGSPDQPRLTFEPGWKWWECLKPLVWTDSCQVRHGGVVQPGGILVGHDADSTAPEVEIGPGRRIRHRARPGEGGEGGCVSLGRRSMGRRRRDLRRLEVETPSAEAYAKGYRPRRRPIPCPIALAQVEIPKTSSSIERLREEAVGVRRDPDEGAEQRAANSGTNAVKGTRQCHPG